MINQEYQKALYEDVMRVLGNILESKDRDIYRAYKAGVSKNKINRLTGIARTTIDRIIERETSKMTNLSEILNEVMRTTRWEKRESDGSTEIRGWLKVEYPEGYKWYIRIASINLVTCNKDGEWHITVEGEQMISVTIEQAAQIMSGMYQ